MKKTKFKLSEAGPAKDLQPGELVIFVGHDKNVTRSEMQEIENISLGMVLKRNVFAPYIHDKRRDHAIVPHVSVVWLFDADTFKSHDDKPIASIVADDFFYREDFFRRF